MSDRIIIAPPSPMVGSVEQMHDAIYNNHNLLRVSAVLDRLNADPELNNADMVVIAGHLLAMAMLPMQPGARQVFGNAVGSVVGTALVQLDSATKEEDAALAVPAEPENG